MCQLSVMFLLFMGIRLVVKIKESLKACFEDVIITILTLINIVHQYSVDIYSYSGPSRLFGL